MLLLTILSFYNLLFVAQSIDRPRGVPLEKASFYARGDKFECFNGEKTISLDHVNDDYCDCSDGSDEPGTSACDNGSFYCENKAFKGTYVLSSRVNDGVCDCCDGSDEYDGTITCKDTCKELSAVAYAAEEAYRKKQSEGFKVKQEYMQQGKRAKDEKRQRLSRLETDKEVLVTEKNKLEAVKVEAETPEKEAIEKHKQAWEAVKAERQKIKDNEKAAKAFEELDTNQDYRVSLSELQAHKEFDIDSDGTVSVEEGKEYLEESEEVQLAEFQEKIWPNIKEIYKFPGSEEQEKTEPVEKDPTSTDDILDEDYDEEKDEYEEDLEEEPEDNEDKDYDDTIEDKKLGEDVPDEEKEPDYDEQTKALIALANEARKIYNEANDKVKDMEREISDIKSYLELDLGPDEEFSALNGQCFEYTDREYTYKFCPFEKTSQKPKGGGIETSLGSWGHWYGPQEDKYDAMKYENGQGCWNGPARSCHVNLHCGAENALIGASEPSRCEYQFEFTTPSRCSQPSPQGHNPHEEL